MCDELSPVTCLRLGHASSRVTRGTTPAGQPCFTSHNPHLLAPAMLPSPLNISCVNNLIILSILRKKASAVAKSSPPHYKERQIKKTSRDIYSTRPARQHIHRTALPTQKNSLPSISLLLLFLFASPSQIPVLTACPCCCCVDAGRTGYATLLCLKRRP